MGERFQIVTTIAFLLFWAVLIFTPYSLVGYWTDGLLALAFIIFAIKTIFNTKVANPIVKWVLRVANLASLAITLGFLYFFFSNPFFIDDFKTRTFYYVYENGKLYNAYFKPVGAYSGGYGNFWITEIPLFFPVVENIVYYERAVHHDFGKDMDFEMNPVDNREVVRNYIKREVH